MSCNFGVWRVVCIGVDPYPCPVMPCLCLFRPVSIGCGPKMRLHWVSVCGSFDGCRRVCMICLNALSAQTECMKCVPLNKRKGSRESRRRTVLGRIERRIERRIQGQRRRRLVLCLGALKVSCLSHDLVRCVQTCVVKASTNCLQRMMRTNSFFPS